MSGGLPTPGVPRLEELSGPLLVRLQAGFETALITLIDDLHQGLDMVVGPAGHTVCPVCFWSCWTFQ